MALYDEVIAQQTSRYPGNVLEISVPPPMSRLERYPGETEMGVGVSPAILELMKQRQRWSPSQDVPQDLPPTRVMPDYPGGDYSGAALSRTPIPAPFGFHAQYQEPDVSMWRTMGLPEWMHPYYQRLQQTTNIPPRILSAEASIPHQVLNSVLHPLFRLLFTGTPFTEQNALTRRIPGLSPALPGRTAMGALADPAASLAAFATEAEVAPEKLFGGARRVKNVYKGNPKGYSMRGTIPGAIYDRLQDLATGTTREERAWKDLQERMNTAQRMAEEDEKLRKSGLATGPLDPHITYGETRRRYVDPEWQYQDAMRRIEARERARRAMQKALDMVGAKRIPVQKIPPK